MEGVQIANGKVQITTTARYAEVYIADMWLIIAVSGKTGNYKGCARVVVVKLDSSPYVGWEHNA